MALLAAAVHERQFVSGRSRFGARAGESLLQSALPPPTLARMATPAGPVTLTTQQIEELNKKLSTMRHDVNNNLSLVVAAAELIKFNPTSAPRMTTTLVEQPPKIVEHLAKFTAEFEAALGIAKS